MQRVLSLLATMALLPAVVWAEEESAAASVHPGLAGQRAYDLLGTIYRDAKGSGRKKLDGAVEEALKEVAADRAKAEEAGEFLLALFQQAAADERNGRAEWKAQPFWGGGSDSVARNFRKDLAEEFKKKAQGEAAVPVALWLLREDRAAAGAAAAMEALRRTHGERADAALASLIAEGVHFRPALVMALEQAAARKLAVKPETLAPWANDPREKVRTAARAASEASGIPPPAAFKPKDGFGPQTAKMLRDIASLLPEPIARDAAFGRFEVEQRYRDDAEPYKSSFIGWNLAEAPAETRAMSWHGELHTLKTGEGARTKVTFTALNPAEQVAEIARLRSANGKNARDDLQKVLSARGGLTGQFQSPNFSTPEALLSAWLFDKGDLATAAALLFPRLEVLDDDRWALEMVRDLVGQQCHQQMLDAFAYKRDYAETLRLAKHLSQPVFDGYQYQERAKEIAAQLPARMEEFKTFVLPTPDEWMTLAAPMSRAQQIEFLGAHLRLINCHQMGQPGGVNYADEQFRAGGNRFELRKGDPPLVPVINPWNELHALHLQPGDVGTLAPLLKDDNYLPTYSYWRDFHPGRTLHRVNWLAAELINDAAKRELVDLREWQNLDAAHRDAQVAKIAAWSREMAGKPVSELLIANMNGAKSDREWLRAAAEAARLKDPATLSALVAGAKKYPGREADVAALCRSHGAPEAAEAARLWIKSKDDGTRLQAALILLRHGSEPEKTDDLGTLRDLLAKKWDDELHLSAVQPIIDSGNPAAIDFACGLMRRKEFDWRMSGGQVAHNLFLTGRHAALEALLAALADEGGAEEEQRSWKGKDVKRKITRADHAAEAITEFRKGFEFLTGAPDSERTEQRKSLAEWLKTQAALLADGKPTPELNTETRPIYVPRWQLDAP